jgi:hypothetical protein
MQRFADPMLVPGTNESPAQLIERAMPLSRTAGETYVEKRGVSASVAHEAGVRFIADFGGRPAVVVPMRDREDRVKALHGRYLRATRSQNKMLTIGESGGAIPVRRGWRADPLILVEGLFDALSLSVCGWSAVATVGRDADWMRDVAKDRTVWIAFDAGRPGEAEAARYGKLLQRSDVRRLTPPPRCKDWNTALVKLGSARVAEWLSAHAAVRGRTST